MSDASLNPLKNVTTGISRIFPYESATWRQTIARSELPDDVRRLIITVIKKSRLMRFEKVEVVQELISHFVEGQQSGQSYSELIADFGNPDLTATLIRRSKIRNRPIMMKIFQFAGWSLLAVMSTYLMVAAYFYLGRPEPGTDYMVDFNRPTREAPQEERAWPEYRSAWIKFEFSEGGDLDTSSLFHKDNEDQSKRLIRPGDPGWPQAVTRLQELDELLAAFRRGAKKPSLGLELQSDISNYSDEDFAALFPALDRDKPDTSGHNALSDLDVDDEVQELMQGAVVNVLLPHIQSFRRAARIFAVDTRRAVQQGDAQRVVENIETMFGLAAQASDSNTLVGGLVGLAIARIAFDQLEEVAVETPDLLGEKQLAQLQYTVEAISIRDWIKLEGERAMMHDIIQRIYTDDGNSDGRITPLGLRLLDHIAFWNHNNYLNDEYSGLPEVIYVARKVAEPASLFTIASRKETADLGDQFIDSYKEEFEKPFWESTDPRLDLYLEKNEKKHPVLAAMLPAVYAVKNAVDRTIGRQEGVLAGIAFQRFRLKYGRWPETFDEVAPEFITEYPTDQINGEFVKFVVEQDVPIIYSVGNDRDDDHGMVADSNHDGELNDDPATLILSSTDENAADGDWILWPQQYVLKSPNQ